MKARLFLLPAITLALLLAACGRAPVPVSVLGVAPEGDGVPLDAVVSATFSGAIDASSLDGNFNLYADGEAVAAEVRYDAADRVARLVPEGGLQAGVSYVAELSNAVTGVSGLAIAAVRSWSFTTATSVSEPTDPEPTDPEPTDPEPSDGAPVIQSLAADRETVDDTDGVTLSWAVSGEGVSLSLAPGIGAVSGDAVHVTPYVTTTYVLTATNASGSDVEEVTVTVDLTGAELPGVQLPGENLAGVDLEGANLEGANLAGANLVGANLRGANLRGANLEGANLEGADLTGADLEGANLRGANLEKAILVGADFSGADLTDAWLEQVLATGADFSSDSHEGQPAAILTGAWLENGDFSSADFYEASLAEVLKEEGAIFSNAQWTDGSTCADPSVGTCNVD